MLWPIFRFSYKRLTTGNFFKVFLLCYCHEIYRVESVGLKMTIILVLKSFHEAVRIPYTHNVVQMWIFFSN